MASTSETGHAKNVANLKSLNEINAGFGAAYNPSNNLLKLATMQAQFTDCDTKQKAVNTQKGVFKPIVNARRDEFKPVKPLVRRVRSAVKSSGAGSEFQKDVNTVIKKILGERITPVVPTESDPSGTSASQQSYDMITDNFNAMVELLVNEPLYTPNETELTVAELKTKNTAMENANNAVKTGVTPYNNAIIARNKALYTTTTGLTDAGQASKEYVRSAFGFSSPEFKLVTKLIFKKLAKV